jgi:hypothetical protein
MHQKTVSRTSEGPRKRKSSYVWRNAPAKRSGNRILFSFGRGARTPAYYNPKTSTVWKQFVRQYEKFTDLLCVAAKNGCDECLESEYRIIRQWFRSTYYEVSERLRPNLIRISPELWVRRRPAFVCCANCYRRQDVFESIYRVESLRKILDDDNGSLIHVISLLSEAVYDCDRDRLVSKHP